VETARGGLTPTPDKWKPQLRSINTPVQVACTRMAECTSCFCTSVMANHLGQVNPAKNVIAVFIRDRQYACPNRCTTAHRCADRDLINVLWRDLRFDDQRVCSRGDLHDRVAFTNHPSDGMDL